MNTERLPKGSVLELECDTHGSSAWDGQVICGKCGAVWWLNHRNPPTFNRCTCGAPISGPHGEARAICAGCYEERRPKETLS